MNQTTDDDDIDQQVEDMLWDGGVLEGSRRKRPELHGFERAGTMTGAEIVTDAPLPSGWGVYVFVRSGIPMYVGSAQNLHRRLRGYARHQSRESTTRLVHAALADAGEVELWVRHWPEPIAMIDGLPVHVPLGVEAGLIARYHPPWNRRGLPAAAK